MIFHNISVFFVCFVDQINAASMTIRNFFLKKHEQILIIPDFGFYM